MRKITEIEQKIVIKWRCCHSGEYLADLGSRGANKNKMVQKKWFEGLNGLLSEEEWPHKPELKIS